MSSQHHHILSHVIHCHILQLVSWLVHTIFHSSHEIVQLVLRYTQDITFCLVAAVFELAPCPFQSPAVSNMHYICAVADPGWYEQLDSLFLY